MTEKTGMHLTPYTFSFFLHGIMYLIIDKPSSSGADARGSDISDEHSLSSSTPLLRVTICAADGTTISPMLLSLGKYSLSDE